MSAIKSFKEVLPALPVIAIILARLYFLFNFAKLFKNIVVSLTLVIFLLFFLSEETTHLAPLLKASLINLFPSLFFPLIAKNKLSFFMLLDQSGPRKFIDFSFLLFLKIN